MHKDKMYPHCKLNYNGGSFRGICAAENVINLYTQWLCVIDNGFIAKQSKI